MIPSPRQHVATVPVELRGRRIEPDGDVTPGRVAGGADRLHQQLHGGLVVIQIRGVAALVTLSRAQTALVQDLAKRVEALGAGAQRLPERREPDRQEHELLEVDARLGVRAAVQHVELRHREQMGSLPAEMAIQRDAARSCGRVARGKAHREDGVGAQIGFVRGAVEVTELRVEPGLIGGVEADQFRSDHGLDVGQCLEHALTTEARRVPVAQFDGFVHPGARTARHPGTSVRAVVERDHTLKSWVASRIEDLEPGDRLDPGHEVLNATASSSQRRPSTRMPLKYMSRVNFSFGAWI